MYVMFFILAAVHLATAMQRAVSPINVMKEENARVKTTLKVISAISVRTGPLICNRTTNMAAVEVCMEL